MPIQEQELIYIPVPIEYFIDHAQVVIGETCNTGNHVKTYQGVTLVEKLPVDEKGNSKRH